MGGRRQLLTGCSDEAGSEGHLVADEGRDGVQRIVEAGRIDPRRAGALVARGAGELAHDGDPGLAGQREHAVVGEQHDALLRRPAGQRVVAVDVEAVGCILQACDGESKDPFDTGVGLLDGGLVDVAGREGCADGFLVGGMGRHLQVEACLQRLDAVVDGAPVAHHEAVEAPIAPQHLGEQEVVLAGVRAVHLVVGAHDRPRPCARDDLREAPQVHLAQGALVDLGVPAHAVGLLVVGREVLHGRADALALDAPHQRAGQLTGHQRVLSEVLEVAAAQRVPLDVHAWTEQHADAERPALLAERDADGVQQFSVPGGGETDGRGKTGGRDGVVDADVVGCCALLAHAVRPIGEHHLGEPGVLDRGGVPEVDASGEADLGLDVGHGVTPWFRSVRWWSRSGSALRRPLHWRVSQRCRTRRRGAGSTGRPRGRHGGSRRRCR